MLHIPAYYIGSRHRVFRDTTKTVCGIRVSSNEIADRGKWSCRKCKSGLAAYHKSLITRRGVRKTIAKHSYKTKAEVLADALRPFARLKIKNELERGDIPGAHWIDDDDILTAREALKQ